MATLKQRLHRKNSSGSYDVVHLETSASCVLMANGTTVEAAVNGKAASDHTHNYAGSSSAGGVATNAARLSNTSAIGSTINPVYFNANGVPVKTTYTLGKSVPSDAVFTDTVYTHPTSAGNKHIPAGGSSGQILRWSAAGTAVWGSDNNTTYGVVSTTADGLAPKRDGSTTKFLRADGTWAVPPDTNTTYSNFVKSGSGAKAGLVPAPSTTAGTTKYLREDGTWAVPPDNNTTYTLSTITGTLAVAKGGTGAATATANYVFAAPNGSNGAPAFRKLVATDIPSLAASKITSGTLGVARGGTGVTSLDALKTALGIGTGIKFVTGSYQGTGTYGVNNPCSLTFDFEPKIVAVYAMRDNTFYELYPVAHNLATDFSDIIWIVPTEVFDTSYHTGFSFGLGINYDSVRKPYSKMSADRKTIYWYNGDEGYDAAGQQFNDARYTYYYFAIG